MIYNEFQNEKISAFAMGCMRLPVIDGDDKAIDEKAAEEMVDYALEHGVNYFDTAWGVSRRQFRARYWQGAGKAPA